MKSIERRINRVERSLQTRRETEYDLLSDEELASRINAYEERILADREADPDLYDAVVYERKNGKSEDRVRSVLRRSLGM